MNRTRDVFRLFLIDVVLGIFAVLAILGWNAPLQAIGGLYLVVVLGLNVFLLRRSNADERAKNSHNTSLRKGRFYLYARSAVFLCGFLYALVLIADGQLPRTTFPILMGPLLISIYLFTLTRGANKR